ncbi:MAG: molecular chaperone DnaJ [Deltaproteobacteria bacterium RIFOXYD12_FULL_57_12]|nr:MAG: molecular chaperone DnaJ [Deltaproteobacteria bacterium RIFOXYD12_FULL_57_12]
MEYRQHDRPGCGGCLLLLALLLFLTGGAPLLLQFLGVLLFVGLFLVFAGLAAFFGFSHYIKRQISTYEKSQTESHNTFVHLLIHILVWIARLDGTVTREEINTIHRFFRQNLHYSQSQMYWVKELVREAMRSTVELETLLADFRQKFAYEPRIILLELIFQVLYTKSRVPDAELQLARNIAEYLEISAYDLRSIENKYRAGYATAAGTEKRLEEQYFKVLGLESGASFDEIKASYRRLSMQYHPDKVGHLGEEFRKVAEEKMKDLNVAYEYLRKKYQTAGG